jgi:hypothetical protein
MRKLSAAATSVINGIPQCDERAGRRIIDEFSRGFGKSPG